MSDCQPLSTVMIWIFFSFNFCGSNRLMSLQTPIEYPFNVLQYNPDKTETSKNLYDTIFCVYGCFSIDITSVRFIWLKAKTPLWSSHSLATTLA